MLLHALDEALERYILRQFEIWMSDPTGQPERAGTGVRKALAAYHRALESIEKADFEAACK